MVDRATIHLTEYTPIAEREEALIMVAKHKERICPDDVQLEFMDSTAYRKFCSSLYRDEIDMLLYKVDQLEKDVHHRRRMQTIYQEKKA